MRQQPDYSAILLRLAGKAKSREEENALILGSRFIQEHTGNGPWEVCKQCSSRS
jgi:hypothetical protein